MIFWRYVSLCSFHYFESSMTDCFVQQHAASNGTRADSGKKPNAAFFNLPILLRHLSELAQELQEFREYLLHGGPGILQGQKLPLAIYRGWIFLLLAMIYGTRKGRRFDTLLSIARRAILSGTAEFCTGVSRHSLSGKAVLLPLDLASMMVLNLTSDLAKYEKRDLPATSVYTERFNWLVCVS